MDSVRNSGGQPAPIIDSDGDGVETVVIRFHATGTLKPTQVTYSCSRDGGASSSCSSPYSSPVRARHPQLRGGGPVEEGGRRRHDAGQGQLRRGGMETSPRSGTGFKFQYGVVEARMALECQQGSWPAVWTSGGTPTLSCPTDGEMDVGEGTSQQTSVSMNQALHMPGGQLQTVTPGPWCDTGFHTYTARWEPGQITFLIDGQQTATYSGTDGEAKGYSWPFDTAGNTQRVIVDLHMGGAVGAVDTSTLPVTMKIDYIPRWVLVTLSV